MKILHIINNLGSGGAEKLLEELLPILKENKDIKIDLLLLTNENNVFEKELREKNVNIDIIKYKNIYNPLNIFEIAKYVNKNNYDIIHSHLFQSKYWLAFARMFIKSKNIYYVTTEHNTSNKRRGKFYFYPIEKYVYSRYDLIISISQTAHDNLINWLDEPISNEKFIVIKNGVKIDKFLNAKAYKKELFSKENNQDIILITMVGRFSEQKDQETLVKAVNYLDNKYHLLLVGEGPLESDLKEKVSNLNIKERVHFLGFRNDVERILKSSNIVVLSSHYEGLSLSSIEGLASGKPFIASDVEGLTEVVENYGLLFEEGNYKELAELIIKLTEDEKFYNKVSLNCIKRAKEYDIEIMAKKLIKNYKLLLNG